VSRMIRLNVAEPVSYRWSGKFVGKDAAWKHVERQLVDFELMVMEKGTLYVEDEWERHEVHEGEWLLMEPTKLQRGYRPSKCRFYWMHFLLGSIAGSGEEVTDGENGWLILPKQGRLENADRVFVLMKQLQDSDVRYMDPTYNGFLATAVLAEIVNQARRRYREGGAVFEDDNTEKTGGALKEKDLRKDGLRPKVDDYLLTHMHQGITVGELADHLGYHEKYLSARFKEETGQSVKKYVDGRKMERAKYLLLNTDALVMEIAENLGYAEVQNFYHVFKGFTNCTPTEFRATYSKKQEFDV